MGTTRPGPNRKVQSLSAYEADREGLVLPLRNRIEHDRRSDVREDEQELQEHTEIDLALAPVPRDETSRVVEKRLEEKRRRDRREEREDEQDSEESSLPLVVSHVLPPCESPSSVILRILPTEQTSAWNPKCSLSMQLDTQASRAGGTEPAVPIACNRHCRFCCEATALDGDADV